MASLGESECSILSGFLEDLEAKKRSDYKERCGIMAAQIYLVGLVGSPKYICAALGSHISL
jgi:hypothetical protein